MEQITSLTAQKKSKVMSNSALLQVSSGFSILMLVLTVTITMMYPSVPAQSTNNNVLGLKTSAVSSITKYVDDKLITKVVLGTVSYSARNMLGY